MSPDQITLRKLVLVKQLYSQAVNESHAGQSMVRRIMAIIGFDLAVETALKAVVTFLDTNKMPADGFQGLVQQAENLYANHTRHASLPDRANILRVHAIRNDAQHKARYPNEDEIIDSRTHVRDFLRKLVQSVWDLDIDAISLVDLILNPEARNHLTTAVTSIGLGEYRAAVNSAAIGLEYALAKSAPAVTGPRPPSSGRALVVVDSSGHSRNESDGRDAYRAFRQMYDSLLFLTLGIDYATYLRFRGMAGIVRFAMSGKAYVDGNQPEVSHDDAEFAVSFATSSVVQIESIVQDIDKPFGRERWF